MVLDVHIPVRDVWSDNLRTELGSFARALQCAGPGAIVAIDTEFPGFVREARWSSSKQQQYDAARANVDLLRPVQLGMAISTAQNQLLGVWCFNLQFNVNKDFHTEASVQFLTNAGISFYRHATQGIDPVALGASLGRMCLAQNSRSPPTWVTFSGLYDLGYLLRMLTNKPLPKQLCEFEEALAANCPSRRELRDWLPHGSLERCLQEHGILRKGTAHTAGSDALATLELFHCVTGNLETAHLNEYSTGIEDQGKSLLAPSYFADTTLAPTSKWGAAALEASRVNTCFPRRVVVFEAI